ncbi:MAG TPA: hypothetical protein VI306_13230 [Pyrinomonadaceae bacterium]
MPLGPATKLFYSVAGSTILINACDDWSSFAVSQLFTGWFLSRLPDSTINPDITITIRSGVSAPSVPDELRGFEITHGGICYTDNENYYLKFGGSLVVFGPDQISLWVDQPYDVSAGIVTQLLSHALSPALRRVGIFEIHSAGVVPPGREKSIMFAGPSGCGKSTLTSQLARCGWGYLSDDILLLRECERKIEAHSFRRFFALTANTLAASKLPGATAENTKARITPQDHFRQVPIETAQAGTIIYPQITGSERSRITSLPTAESMQRLLRLCPWASYDKPTSAEHLKVLGLLANTTNAFELFAGADILKDANAAADLIKKSVP